MSVVAPFPAWAWPLAWEWIQAFRDRVLDDFGPQTCDEFVARAIERSREEHTWAVYRDDELGGLVSFQAWNPIAGTTHCLFKRSFWGSAAAALALVYDEVFQAGVHTVASFVFADNHAIRGLAPKIGARELRDPIRSYTMRHGKPVDAVILELSKDDFYDAIRSGGADHRGDREYGRRRSDEPPEDLDQ